MRSFFIISVVLVSFIWVSCFEGRDANQNKLSDDTRKVKFFSDSISSRYLKTEQTDSTTTIFVYNEGDSSFTRKIVERDNPDNKQEGLAVLNNTTAIDSNTFYSSIYPAIESKVFSLPRDRKILDQTWRRDRSKKLVIHIDRIKIDSKSFTEYNRVFVGLKIKVNKKGRIVDVAYYSKDQQSDHVLIPIVSDDLLAEIINELKTMSIPPYSLLGIAVDVETPITVKIIHSVTVPSKSDVVG